MTSTVSSSEFNRGFSKAKKFAAKGPVFITKHGVPKYVLLTIEDYLKLKPTKSKIAEMLAMPGSENIDFNPEPLAGNIIRPVDFDS